MILSDGGGDHCYYCNCEFHNFYVSYDDCATIYNEDSQGVDDGGGGWNLHGAE